NPTGGTESVILVLDNSRVHPPYLRERARRLHADGVPFIEIYRRLGLSRNTVACWLYSERERKIASRRGGGHLIDECGVTEVARHGEQRNPTAVGYHEKIGCISVRTHWMHWPCLILQ